jgi:hypothetical protein
MTAPPPVEHDIICDECGVSPVTGVRYKATHIYDYDVCQMCIGDYESERDKFVAFETPVASKIACRVCPELGSRINASSFHKAALQLCQNHRVHYATIHFDYAEDAADVDHKELQFALASNKHIHTLHIHMCNTHSLSAEQYSGVISNISEGLGFNTCIRRVFMYIRDRSEGTALAIREMIETNVNIETLFIKRPCHSSSRPPKKLDEKEDAFGAAIIKGLGKNSTIRSFRLDSMSKGVFSEKNKELLLDVVKKNSSIKRAYMEFEGDYDQRLNLLVACNRGKWIERFTDTSVPTWDRLNVLLEARGHESVEPVAALYHLIRSCPDLLQTPSST